MAEVKANLKASLAGSETPEVPLTTQVKAHFMANARTDGESGELYMPEGDFINAIAPKNENYVSITTSRCEATRVLEHPHCAAFTRSRQHWLTHTARPV